MIKIIRGDDTTITVTFKDSDGVAIDITGATVFFTVKSDIKDVDGSALISKDITSHSDPVNGITEVVLTNADTTIDTGTHLWDLQIKYTNGKIQSVNAGKIQVSKDVTQRTS